MFNTYQLRMLYADEVYPIPKLFVLSFDFHFRPILFCHIGDPDVITDQTTCLVTFLTSTQPATFAPCAFLPVPITKESSERLIN